MKQNASAGLLCISLCVVFLAVGWVAGIQFAGKNTKALDDKISSVQRQVLNVASAVLSNRLDAENLLSLGNPDNYETLGPFWQGRGVQLVSDPQGCRVVGEILYRLSVRRQNINVSVELVGSKTVAQGTAVLSQVTPGIYQPFSVVIRTDAKLSDISHVRVKLDENTGTTAPVY